MSDLTKLQDILDNQAERGIKSGDWPELSYERENRGYAIYLHIEPIEVGFAFSRAGRLIGAFNWKE